MFKLSDVLGTLIQTGLSQSSTKKLKHAMGAGEKKDGNILSDLLGGAGDMGDALSGLFGGGKTGGVGGVLQDVLGDAKNAFGGDNKLAVGGLGALAGALLGGGKGSMKGALGGGVMAILGAVAYSALKGSGQTPREIPIGLREPENQKQEEQLESDAGLVLKAMINAAKADGKIDQAEVQKIIGKLEEAGAGKEIRNAIIAEMNGPMDTQGIVNAVGENQQLGAELLVASLLAIEVDTPAERKYVNQLASSFGLSKEVVSHMESSIGMR